MINLSGIKFLATRSLGRTGLVLSQKSPEILLGLGIVSGVGCVFLACKATLKLEEVTEKAKETIKKIEEGHTELDPEVYSEKDYKQDLAVTYIKTGVEYAKLYAPAMALGAVAVGLIFGSHHILSKRNVALVAAYKVVDLGYKNYRERVRKELGDDADLKFRLGNTEDVVTVTGKGKNGKVKTETVHTHVGLNEASEFARYFDDKCPAFQRSYEMNSYFLRSQQNYANDKLNAQGHVFLNEIYDMLGMDRTSAGAIVGWVSGFHKGDRDGYVNFGLENPVNEQDHKYDSINEGQPLFLDFNVDGIIWDLIS